MSRFCFTLLFSVLISLSAWAVVGDAEKRAAEAGKEYLNDEEKPFQLRTESWKGDMPAKSRKVIQHQLLAGNEYWFWMASSNTRSRVNVHIYDAKGNLIENEAWQKGSTAGARIKPPKSGLYNIVISVEASIEQVTNWAVVYAYR